jgi:hypothetical protein
VEYYVGAEYPAATEALAGAERNVPWLSFELVKSGICRSDLYALRVSNVHDQRSVEKDADCDAHRGQDSFEQRTD